MNKFFNLLEERNVPSFHCFVCFLLSFVVNAAAQHQGSIDIQKHRVNGVLSTNYSEVDDVLRYSALSNTRIDAAVFWQSLRLKVTIFRGGLGLFFPMEVYAAEEAVTWPAVEENSLVQLDEACSYQVDPLEQYYHTGASLYYLDENLDPQFLGVKFGSFSVAQDNGIGE